MGMLYFTGGALGTLNGLLSAGLAYGKGWRRKGTGAAAALGAVFGCYEIWICGALNRDFWGMLLLSGALLSASLTDLDSREINPRSMAVYAVALLAYQASGMSLPVCIKAESFCFYQFLICFFTSLTVGTEFLFVFILTQFCCNLSHDSQYISGISC